jgi:hypothetical protein
MNKSNLSEACEMLNEANAAKYIGMSRSYLRQARMDGHLSGRTKGPAFIRFGRTIRYHISDLNYWLDVHRVIQPYNKDLFFSKRY